MAAKKGKLCAKVNEVNGSEFLHTLLLQKYCKEMGVNLSFLTCELLPGIKLRNDYKNNIIPYIKWSNYAGSED